MKKRLLIILIVCSLLLTTVACVNDDTDDLEDESEIVSSSHLTPVKDIESTSEKTTVAPTDPPSEKITETRTEATTTVTELPYIAWDGARWLSWLRDEMGEREWKEIAVQNEDLYSDALEIMVTFYVFYYGYENEKIEAVTTEVQPLFAAPMMSKDNFLNFIDFNCYSTNFFPVEKSISQEYDGRKQYFSIDKISNKLEKSFISCEEPIAEAIKELRNLSEDGETYIKTKRQDAPCFMKEVTKAKYSVSEDGGMLIEADITDMCANVEYKGVKAYYQLTDEGDAYQFVALFFPTEQ